MTILKKIIAWLLPYTCILCGNKSTLPRDLCLQCQNYLPFTSYTCICCGTKLKGISSICGQCLKNPPQFNRTFALFSYQPPIDKLIIDLKFHNKLLYADILGRLFAHHLSQCYKNNKLPEFIIPVPLYKKRLQERGFNQALEIARPISKVLKIPIDIQHCYRIRATEAQSLIPVKQRFNNVKNAFAIEKSFSANHIAIIDDVMTTGYTVNELSKTLKKQSIKQIDIWCIAHT